MPGPLDTAQVTSSRPPTSQPSRKGRTNEKSGKFRVFTAKRLKHNRNNKISKTHQSTSPRVSHGCTKNRARGVLLPCPQLPVNCEGGRVCTWGLGTCPGQVRLPDCVSAGNRPPDGVTAHPLTPPSCPTCCQAGSGPLQGQGRRRGHSRGWRASLPGPHSSQTPTVRPLAHGSRPDQTRVQPVLSGHLDPWPHP